MSVSSAQSFSPPADSVKRVRPGGDKRGSSRDRARRKAWMLLTFGNGFTCPCAHCGEVLSRDSVEADRIIPGGSYRRENIQPSCRRCNAARSNKVGWTFSPEFLKAS